MHQSSQSPNLSGCWRLAPRHAVSVHARASGQLTLAQGRVWVTLDGPHPSDGRNAGDHVLRAGQSLPVAAGQRLVIEDWPESLAAKVPEAACFKWEACAADQGQTRSRWRGAVVYPLHDLGLALGMGGRALGRLAQGLLGYGEYLQSGRGRVLSTLELNQP